MNKALGMVMLCAAAAWAQPGAGDPAPDFTHQSLDHGQIKLSDHRGKVIYLFFMGHN